MRSVRICNHKKKICNSGSEICKILTFLHYREALTNCSPLYFFKKSFAVSFLFTLKNVIDCLTGRPAAFVQEQPQDLERWQPDDINDNKLKH